MIKNEKWVESSFHRVITDKMFSRIGGKVKAEEKGVTVEKLTATQHNHQY